ncbi:short chain isoprenyl diphosphate synthase IdsA [Kitasatospora atroaurantiaca]|uniref:Geranylgeranyl diphosphate synthase type I n=1 Tax=Kitasatospora atroaurantiaca TaxID=285545 RepID=A0A561EN85_9ACTN|nr:polyprenyl synthetase family protein [Kitasatospora atroaurantiaca]TWE17078.1 geranylgeranyl diphosphate synthase type I [Kitasatospora atroaurantiaca]
MTGFDQISCQRADSAPAADPPAADAVRVALAAEFASRWPADATGLDAVHRYALIPSGKLLRPLLVAHSALALGGDLRQVLPAAIGFECAHVGSLLHDDIIDRDATRRGQPAVHAAFGLEQAIIAGNALYFSWFTALADCQKRGASDRQIAAALDIQARAGVETCRGAADELAMAGDLDGGIAAYMEMARRKTAVLLSAACRVGAILADATTEQAALLSVFGEHLGLAFQIRDDLLPYSNDHDLGNKPGDSDIRNRRPTLPILLALEATDSSTCRTLRRVLLTEADHHKAHRQLRALLERTGAISRARAIADRHAAQAQEAISELPPGPHTKALNDLTVTHATVAGPTPSGR